MKHLLATAGLVALTACTGTPGDVLRSYNETGGLVDGGTFGNANMQNHLVHTGQQSYVFDLSNRFASEVLTTVNFAFNSAQLDAGARDTLREQARWIKQFPEVRFKVYGHTDAVGSTGYNKSLGLRRARAAVNFLVSQGISRNRLEAVVSFGEAQPLIVTQGRERRNRRTVTEVSGFVQSHPVIMNGKYAEVVFRETILSAKPESNLIRADNAGSVVSGE
ncbi:OmpA family protein [Roseovarius sp. 2305UL8-3]|uniref:OmpA family protein n=1 Tax=Roseovarius conchicola TaxID=3121636 RepID=UPI00352977A7